MGLWRLPVDWTKVATFPRVLIPQTNGSFQTVTGSGGSDGTFTIPNVPGGYCWLQAGPAASFWTSSSTFDFGADINTEMPSGSTTSVSTTGIILNHYCPGKLSVRACKYCKYSMIDAFWSKNDLKWGRR